jgi:uncharacterized protein
MSNIVEKEFTLTSAEKAPIWGDLRWKDGALLENGLPVIIICHGFKAFKDWGPFPAIGRRFAELGFVSIVFNFSHNGIGVGDRRFTEPGKFEKNTLSLELDDVRRIVDAVQSGELESPADSSRIGIIGHSRGGGIALVGAGEDMRLRAVSAWGSISRFDRYTHEQKIRWREQGYVNLPSVGTRSPFRLGVELLNDIEENGSRLNILRAVSSLGKPLLIVHGSEDIPVKLKEAELLYRSAEKNLTEFVILKETGHTFGAKHPYRTESPAMSHVVELTAAWFHSKM